MQASVLDQPSVLQGKLSGVGWLDPQKRRLRFNSEQPPRCSPQQLHRFTLPPTVRQGSSFTPSPAPAVRITFPGEKPRRIFPGATAEGGAGRVPVLGTLGPWVHTRPVAGITQSQCIPCPLASPFSPKAVSLKQISSYLNVFLQSAFCYAHLFFF